jgi:hypothetical protein
MPASKTPYGPKSEVEYADPGYQADGKARYPLSDEEKCRAAWSYINMPKNAAKYSPADLAKVKAKIKAALKRYGVEVSEDVKAAADGGDGSLLGVELARPGPWKAHGKDEFTDQDLRDAADFFAASGGQAVPIGLGHVDKRFDGEPSFGSVTNIRYAEDDRGPVLLGDIVDMPEWLAASAPKRWPNRSIEGWQNFTWGERTYSLILSGLKFLGVTPPAVMNIRSLSDLKAAIAASSATPVFASAPAPVDDLAAPPQSPVLEAEEIPEVEESGMDPAKFREALGLAPDASDDEVRAAFAAALPPPTPAPEPVQASLFDAPAETAAPTKAPVAAAGTIVLASSVWEETQKTIKALSDHVAKTKRDERDEVIAKAVVAGKFTPAQKPHFSRLWDADPDGTRKLIDTLTPNSALAVMASGYAGESEEAEFEAEYAQLFRRAGVNHG